MIREIDLLVENLSDSERELLAKKGYFVISSDRTHVYCPQGYVLRKKSTKKDGRVRFISKRSCSICTKPCTTFTEKRKWKEVDYTPKSVVKGIVRGQKIQDIFQEI